MESAGEILVKSVLEGVALVAVLVLLYEIHRVASVYCAPKKEPMRFLPLMKRYYVSDGTLHESEAGDWVFFHDVERLAYSKERLEEELQMLRMKQDEDQSEILALRRLVENYEIDLDELRLPRSQGHEKKEG